MNSEKSHREKVHHEDWYCHIPDMRSLILGTFPPDKSKWNYPFYYPNKANNFWPTMAKVANRELKTWEGEPAVIERIELMKQLKVGVQNIGQVIEREDKSAEDSKISILQYQDIIGIIQSSCELKNILLTGYSGKTSTYKDFRKYLKSKGIKYTNPDKVKAKNTFTIVVNHRIINCIIGNSTSGAARRGGVTFEDLVEQFRLAIETEKKTG